MANPTWRNVANTVTGNPAAALSAANSAFGTARIGADSLANQATEQRALDAKNASDDALQAIFGKGDLAGVDQNADFGAILDSSRAGNLNDANIARAEDAGAYSREQLRVSGVKNSPAALAAAQKLAETTANTAATRANTAAQAAQNQTNEFTRLAQERKDETDNNVEWNQHLGEALAEPNAEAVRRIEDIKSKPITENYTLADKQNEILDVEDSLGALVQEITDNTALSWTSQTGILNPKRKQVGQAFDIADGLNEEGRARRDAQQKADIDYQERVRTDFKAAIGNSPTALAKVGYGAGGEPYALDNQADIDANTIRAGTAIQDIKDKAGVYNIGVDKDLAARYKTQIEGIVAAVGGNKQIFDELMKNVKYNRDTAFLWWGGEDDIEGLPTVEEARVVGKAFRDRTRALYEGLRTTPKSAADRFYGQRRKSDPATTVNGEPAPASIDDITQDFFNPQSTTTERKRPKSIYDTVDFFPS